MRAAARHEIPRAPLNDLPGKPRELAKSSGIRFNEGVHGIHGSINTRRTDAYRCDTYQEDVHERLESCSCPRTQATCSRTILTICTLHDHDQRANTDCSTLAYFVSVHIKAVHPSHPNR